MSCLIDDTDNVFLPLQDSLKIDSLLIPGQASGNQLVLGCNSDHLSKFAEGINGFLLTSTSSGYLFSLRFYVAKVYKKLAAISTVYVNTKDSTLNLEVKLLVSQTQYLRVQSNQRKKILLKILSQKSSQNSFKIKIDEKGDITLCFPYFYSSSEFKNKSLMKNIQRIIKDFKYSLNFNLQILNAVLEITGEKIHKQKNVSSDKQQLTSFLKNYQLQKIMNLELCFGSETKQEQQSLTRRWLIQKQSRDRIKDSYLPVDKHFRSSEIYNRSPYSSSDKLQPIQGILFLDGEQREKIKIKIQLPRLSQQKTNEPEAACKSVNKKSTQQIAYILNYIIINKLDLKNRSKKINSGGFTDIYLSQMIYWYLGSQRAGTSYIASIISQPPVKKCLAIKRQNTALMRTQQRNRITHQKYILKKLKHGVPFFLCRYYLPEKCPELQNDLLSDYIESPNFSDYCIMHSQILSLHTKIYFSLMIAQGLRYLKQYKIVHLDLKPSNIMTSKRLTLKLIDFGQSYHPDLGKHVPGFTMPYSAPQNYTQESQFTFKNDVFSLGVIMYELFFGKCPFNFYSDSLRQRVYLQGNYLDYFYFSPQESQMAGQHIVFPLIQAIIKKCLHPDPRCRPQLQWIVYLLRQCLNYFY